MIPKVIHYCWFGRNPLPKDAIICINSWKKNLPDFEIKYIDCHMHSISAHYISVHQKFINKQQPC